MDAKADLILKHYKNIIENKEFDEFDILGFLIFIRSYIENDINFNSIKEFSDLIAHRERDRGKIMNSISNAIKSNYFYDINTKKVSGYTGISEMTWKKEWKDLGNKFNIQIDDIVIKEITLCIFSLAQKSIYNKDGYSGVVEFDAISKDGEIALLTTEGNTNSFYICFLKYGGYKVDSKCDVEPILDIVYTFRDNGKLKLKCKSDTIIEVV